MPPTRIEGDVVITGNCRVATLTTDTGTLKNGDLDANAAIASSKLAQRNNQPYAVPLTDLRVHDAVETVLPGTAANDDLALDSGTFGTEAMHVTAGDLKAAGATTRYARTKIALPPKYVDGQTVTIRVVAKMETTVADTSCTVDVEAYEVASDLTVGSDLCATAAQNMNAIAAANYDFTITASGLAAGDELDVRVAIACNDAATATVVEPVISKIQLLCDDQ